MNRQAVRELPKDEQPRYRVQQVGVQAMSNVELLQLVWAFKYMDTPQQLLTRAKSLSNLYHMSVEELTEVQDVGSGAAVAIKAALELGRRMVLEANQDNPSVRSPSDAATLLLPQIGNQEQENFCVILLDTKNRVIGVETLYVGTLNSCWVRTGEVFKPAIRRNAAAIIIAHNHPSGDPSPSPADVALTRKIVEAGQIMDIEVLDHVIVGKNNWISLKERGLGFKNQ